MVKLEELFDIKYGVNLELINCDLATTNEDYVNFVSRTSENNGVSAKVKKIDGVEPQKAGAITVAGGGSVLSTFLQKKPFYSGRDLYVLTPKREMTIKEKLYYCLAIKANAYKYNYGRQANRTLRDIIVPKNPPSWIEKIEINKLETINKSNPYILNTTEWKNFTLSQLFDISAGRYIYSYEYDEGSTPYVTATNKNNGISKLIDLPPDYPGKVITTEKVNCKAYYQDNAFSATSDVNILKPKMILSKHAALFIVTVINFNENYRWNYGRQCRVNDSKKIVIKLPAKEIDNVLVPDVDFMENYMLSLPYADLI